MTHMYLMYNVLNLTEMYFNNDKNIKYITEWPICCYHCLYSIKHIIKMTVL